MLECACTCSTAGSFCLQNVGLLDDISVTQHEQPMQILYDLKMFSSITHQVYGMLFKNLSTKQHSY